MNDIDGFVEYVIRELCEGCTECEPRLPADWMNTNHLCCTTEGKVKWLLDLKERYKHEQDEQLSTDRR